MKRCIRPELPPGLAVNPAVVQVVICRVSLSVQCSQNRRVQKIDSSGTRNYITDGDGCVRPLRLARDARMPYDLMRSALKCAPAGWEAMRRSSTSSFYQGSLRVVYELRRRGKERATGEAMSGLKVTSKHNL